MGQGKDSLILPGQVASKPRLDDSRHRRYLEDGFAEQKRGTDEINERASDC